MILLSFTVRNHKSIRDEITLDLTRPELKTLQPHDGDWAMAVYPLVGIFGGNATGKSAVLDAMHYAFQAVKNSATVWQASPLMYRAPFKLDGDARTSTSSYEMDVVHNSRRYRYGFEVDRRGIKKEWLRDLPSSRWRTLFTRDREEDTLKFHRSIGSGIEVTSRELVLSRSLLLEKSTLHAFAVDIVESFDIVLVKDSHRTARLRNLADSLVEGEVDFADLEALLQVADIGVTEVGIEERDIPEPIRRALLRFQRDLRAEEPEKPETGGETSQGGVTDDVELEEELDQVVRNLNFTHQSRIDDISPFSIDEESDGTIAWLATAVPALETLRSGGLLLVDEIDASLHPHLLEVLLGAFADPDVNINNAQLIFTSHESYVLTPLSDVELEPEQVWFTDKTNEGVTELFSLADFPRHPDANVAKRYLTGRYGGTPRLSPSLFEALVEAG